MKKPPLKTFLHSFRFRQTLWFVLILALILGGFSLFVYFRQAQVLRSEADIRLAAQASQLKNLLKSDYFQLPDEFEHIPNLSDELPLINEYEQFALLNPDGSVIQQSEHFSSSDLSAIYQTWLTAGETNSSIPYEITFSHSEEDNGHLTTRADYLFIVSRFEASPKNYGALVLGSPLDPNRQLPRLAVMLIVVYVLILLIAFGGGYWLANQAMRPVQTITRTAQALSERSLDQRLNLTRQDELGELASTFDQMLDRLQTAFERQRQFTSDASHELRTPLTIIELEANRALERPRSTAEYREALATIQSENEWMSRLVNELLTLARLDSGRTAMHLETISLKEMAVDAVERLTPLAEEQHITLQTGELAESTALADRSNLTHVLVNLIENGINYAGGPQARVTVSTGQKMQAGQLWAWVTVSDNGPGISAEHLPHLFDRFYRVDEARTRDEESENTSEGASGSGLGLAIVQSIVEAQGGRVEVRSQPGEGAEFTVWLPGAK